jgi:hypothetical protein
MLEDLMEMGRSEDFWRRWTQRQKVLEDACSESGAICDVLAQRC